MKRTLAFAVLALCAMASVHAQTVPATITVTWTLPTLNTDGSAIPATGGDALAKVEGWISTAVIPNVPTTAPTFTVTPAGTTTVQTVTVAPGATVRVRIRAVNNSNAASDLTNEVTVVAPAKPGLPTNVKIQIAIG